MYVIGINDFEFLNIESKTMMTPGFRSNYWNEIEKVTYGCDLSKTTIYSDYDTAAKILEEIKNKKDEIYFRTDNIIGRLINEEKGNKFDVDALKIYELVPTECKNV